MSSAASNGARWGGPSSDAVGDGEASSDASEHDVEAQLVSPAKRRLSSDVDARGVVDARAAPGSARDPDADATADAHANADDDGYRPMSRRRQYYTVGLLTLTAMFLYADQNLLSPNLSAVAEEFGLDDREKDLMLGGWLQLAFFVVGSPASLIIGWAADRVPRLRLFVITVIIGEGPCLATYWVETYWQLFAVRALTGVAVGGCLPILFSLCGDMFPASERNYVASFLTIATGAGIAVGQIMAGTVGPAFGWRLPFLLASGPAIALALLLYATVREPGRGAAEDAVLRRRRARLAAREERDARIRENDERRGADDGRRGADDGRRGADDGRRDAPAASSGSASSEEYSAKIDPKKLWRQLKIPSNAIILAQGLPGTVPWGMLNAYFVDFLHVQKGLTVEEGTLAVTLFGAGAACGTVVGGVVGQRIYNRPGGRSAIAVVMGVTTALGALPGYFFLNVSTYGPGNVLLHLSCLVGGVLAAVTPPNVRAVLLNVNPPETRGTMFAFYSQIDDVGKGGGPALVAALIVAYGRTKAFNVAVSGWVLCGAILLCLRRYIDADVVNAQRAVQEELDAEDEKWAAMERERERERERDVGVGLNSEAAR